MSQAGALNSDSGGATVNIQQITPDTGIIVVPSAGNVNIFGGTNVETVGTPSTLTINSLPNTFSYFQVTVSPYSVFPTDYYLGVVTSTIAITIRLPNAPTTGHVWVVKDKSGNASVNNITVTTTGGVVLIDGATSFVMNTNYQAAQFIFNGTSYEVF